MQETTFNSSHQANGYANYASIHLWLGALYSEASQKNTLQNLDFTALAEIQSLNKLQDLVNYRFKNSNHLMNAFTQSTFCYEFKNLNNLNLISNERLEFLGDSLVNFLIAKILFKLYPESNEGELSKLRGALVNEHSLAKLAKSISLGENLLLGKGEYKNLGQLKESLLADAFEAFCAAIFIDSGEDTAILEKTILVIIKKYEAETKNNFFALNNLELFDSKTQLQELSMSLFQMHPTYKSFENEQAGFRVELWIGERKLAEGTGASKKKLEKELARVVLDEKRYQL
ncbi:MAG: ribonuclease III [Bacteriovorax sp.]|nr:ribonuclease III [Bacteriovorax sp.]